MMIKHQGVFDLLVHSDKDAPEENTFDVTHLVNPSFYTSSAEVVLLVIQAADTFIRNANQPVPFQKDSFYRAG